MSSVYMVDDLQWPTRLGGPLVKELGLVYIALVIVDMNVMLGGGLSRAGWGMPEGRFTNVTVVSVLVWSNNY